MEVTSSFGSPPAGSMMVAICSSVRVEVDAQPSLLLLSEFWSECTLSIIVCLCAYWGVVGSVISVSERS